jgi:hypothetical protein
MSWSGIILVVVGALLLANNFDLLPLGWLRQWWPAILIAVGVMSLVRPDRARRRRATVTRSIAPARRRPRP